MNFLNQFYDKVYVISLKSNHERRKNAHRQLEKWNIEFEFFDAVDGKDLDKKYIDKVYDEELALNHKTGNHDLSKSEIGCALSHLTIYEQMIAENIEKVLVLEDDIHVDEEAYQKLPEVHENLPEDWELLYYGILHNFKAPLSYRLKLYLYYPFLSLFKPSKLNYSYQELRRIFPKKYNDKLLLAGYHHGTHAYGITKTGAEKLLNLNRKIAAPIDCTIGAHIVSDDIRGYLVKDLVFIQNPEFESEVRHSRFS